MLVKQLVRKYLNFGYDYKTAQNLAAEEIILCKIASSGLAEHVTLKGGIVMYKLTNNSRRATQDIDFDFIRYSIDEESIKTFIGKLSSVNDGIQCSLYKGVVPLNQEDYKGVRIHIMLKDPLGDALKIKLDIGVHTYSAIEQTKLLFAFSHNNNGILLKVNPPEQIFAEKILSLGRLGSLSTRYKDIYDMHYLIVNNLLDREKIRIIIGLFLASTKRKPNNILDLLSTVENALNDNMFVKEATKPASKWADIDYEEIKNTIVLFVREVLL